MKRSECGHVFQKGDGHMPPPLTFYIMEDKETIFIEYPDLVNIVQLQKMLGINRHTAYDIIARKEIVAVKIGRKYFMPKIDIIRYIYKEVA